MHLICQNVNNSFTSLCYSNCETLINQWYAWLWKYMEENIPRQKKHRATLPPWITPQLRTLLNAVKHYLENRIYFRNHKLSHEIQNQSEILFADKDLKKKKLDILTSRKITTKEKGLRSIRRAPKLLSKKTRWKTTRDK